MTYFNSPHRPPMTASSQAVANALASKIDASLVHELLKEYTQAKDGNWRQDWEISILHAARFAEVLMAVLVNLAEKRVLNLNDLTFDPLFKLITNKHKSSADDEILMLAIPRVAASIYAIRNKKRVAHVKSIDPDLLDSMYCVMACDWILSELVMLVQTTNPTQAKSMIDSIIEKKLPFIEEFEDGSVVVLRTELNFVESVQIMLYHFYPDRVSNEQLGRQMRPKYPQLLTSTLGDLERKRLIHRNEQGSKLTKLGISTVQEMMLAYQKDSR